MLIKCRVKQVPRVSKLLGGTLKSPLAVDVVWNGMVNAALAYQQAKEFFKLHTGLNVQFNFIPISETLVTAKHSVSCYILDVKAQAALFSESPAFMRQLVYNPHSYTQYNDEPFYSCAYQSGKGTIEYSQVVAPTVWTEPLHELCHSWYDYFGITDNTHKYLYGLSDSHPGQATVEEAFVKIFYELKLYLTTQPMQPGYIVQRGNEIGIAFDTNDTTLIRWAASLPDLKTLCDKNNVKLDLGPDGNSVMNVAKKIE